MNVVLQQRCWWSVLNIITPKDVKLCHDYLSVKYKIKKENIKFIITQNVTNYWLIRKNCFLCFRLKVL